MVEAVSVAAVLLLCSWVPTANQDWGTDVNMTASGNVKVKSIDRSAA
jgi:hypothetical protein